MKQLFIVVFPILLITGCGDDDPPTGSGNRSPVLDSIGSQSTLEGAQLVFTVSGTDPDGTAPLLSVDSLPPGAAFLDSGNGTGLFDWTPTFEDSGSYLVTFYADDGALKDSEQVTISVANVNGGTPTTVAAVNGDYYIAVMGSDSTDRTITFAVRDSAGTALPGQKLRFTLTSGDGTLAADSLVTDSTGLATVSYIFDGSLGTAIIRAVSPGVDSVEVDIRANTVIPGVGGQAQFVLFADKYIDVKNYNGIPASVDFFSIVPDIVFLNYETALGVVIPLDNVNNDSTAYDTAQVLGAIINTIYQGKTADSIGIGTPIASIRAVYGVPDTSWIDGTPPPAAAFQYNSVGILFFCDLTVDTLAFEIHLWDPVSPSPPGSGQVTNFDRKPPISFPGRRLTALREPSSR